MKLPELKEKLKSKYIVRVVAGVLTIALVGTGIGATAVFAEKNSTAVTDEADSTTDSSKDADDIADKIMDSVSLKDNDADKDESVYLISDANGNVNKTIVVDHLKNKDKKDTLEDASNLSDIENVKGKEKFTQSGDKLTWQAGGKDIYYQGTATEEPPCLLYTSAANSNTSTTILKRQLEDPDAHIIITTIQKLATFIKKNPGHEVYTKHIVIIFDECHRSQFGDCLLYTSRCV